MTRWLAPALLMLFTLTASATAAPVRTYAYISDLDVTETGTDFVRDHCAFTVRVPPTPLDHAPHGAALELLGGASTAHDYLVTDEDGDFDCWAFKHTWQLVTVDSHDKGRVHIAFPPARPGWLKRGFFLLIGFFLLGAIVKRRFGRPSPMFKRRMARNDKRSGKADVDQVPRAQVVESKRGAPPSE